MPSCDLCVVIPTLNEHENIAVLLDRLKVTLPGIRYEVVVVDDDSTDGTAAVVRKRASAQTEEVRAIHRIGRRGLASACIEGMLATSAPCIAVMDADLQHDEAILPEMYRQLTAEGLDLVVASRNVEGGSMGEFSAWRIKLSRLGRQLSGVEKHANLTDPMSGFFIVRRSFFESVAHKLTGVGFKILLDVVLSSTGRIRFGEVPYRFRLREHGQSKLDIIVGIEYLELLLDKWVGNYISVRFALFALVGAVGAVVHLLLLWLLIDRVHLPFVDGQATSTAVVILFNFVLNNSFTYRDQRLSGLAFWLGMLTFSIACSLGFVANLSLSNEAFHHGIPWPLAALIGLLFSGVWNYGVTSMTTWRRTRRSALLRAERRASATARLTAEL